MKFIDDEIYFVARLKSSDYKAEQRSLKSNDEDVEIELTKARRRNYIGKNEEAIILDSRKRDEDTTSRIAANP